VRASRQSPEPVPPQQKEEMKEKEEREN